MYSLHALSERSSWINSLNPYIGALASSIIHRSTSQIFLYNQVDNDRKANRSPDAAFIHVGADFPGVVTETSRKDLPKLTEDYILGSVANVSVVIGLDIEYRGTKKGDGFGTET